MKTHNMWWAGAVLIGLSAIGLQAAGTSGRATAVAPAFSGPGAAVQDTTPRGDIERLISRVEAPQDPRRHELDGLSVAELMRRFGVPGMGIAVIHDFEIDWTRSYGVADAATGRPVEAGTLFQPASISKPVSAVAALRLAQEGLLDLDEDVNSILESWQVPEETWTRDNPVTVRSLLSHTSGADDGFGFPGYAPGTRLPSLRDILEGDPPSNVGPVQFTRPPFAAYKYSGGGFVLLQLALQDLTGTSFEDLMRALVFDPLGMENSTYAQPLPGSWEGRAARAHGARGQRLNAPWHVYPEQAAAGLWTTPTDLAQVVLEVQRSLRNGGGRVLTQSSAQALITPTGVGPSAVGFEVGREGEGWYFEHGGDNYGFQALVMGHVRHGYGIVVLTNGADGLSVAREFWNRVARAYDWDSTHEPLPR